MPYDPVKDFAPVAQVGDHADHAQRASLARREGRERPDRAGEGQSRQVHLRLVRTGLDPASVRRAVQIARGRTADPARAVSRLGADDGRSGRRADLDGVRCDADRAAADPVRRDRRSSAPAWRSACACCPICRPCRSRGSRASSATPGTRSWRPPARRRRSSRSSPRAIKVALDDPNVIKRLQDAGVDPDARPRPEGDGGLHQGRARQVGADHQDVGRGGELMLACHPRAAAKRLSGIHNHDRSEVRVYGSWLSLRSAGMTIRSPAPCGTSAARCRSRRSRRRPRAPGR